MFGGSRHRARTAPGSLRAEDLSYSVPSSPVNGLYPCDRPGSGGSLPDPEPRATVAGPMATKRSPFSKAELDDLKKRLEEEREELQRQAAEIEEASFGTPQSELTGEVAFDEEYADAGTATFERERDLSLSNNIRDLTEKVDRALERIAGGTYGLCERCGKPIEKARIRALPYATLCIKDKQAEGRAG